ncbi:MAG: BolA family protein [Gammaproteobacteria bacterium]
MQANEISAMIAAAIPDAIVEVQGDDGAHFDALIVSEQFVGKSMLQQHQLVYAALGEKMGKDIHALSMQTFTPEQWEKKKSLRID